MPAWEERRWRKPGNGRARRRGRGVHLGDQRVCEGGLAVVHVGNHGHVPDVLLLVHTFSHLVSCEVHLGSLVHINPTH